MKAFRGNPQNISLTNHVKKVLLIRLSIENMPVNGSGLSVSIMFKKMMM